ncbi:hypothetical protein BGZ49_002027 [Haplosporangium sp. Z 27]|nr:hypothetical protein BGZ49_002027 [Haplosporangium sp. Z 27]
MTIIFEQPSQKIRSGSPTVALDIVTRLDNKGQHIVLWSEVQRVFKNADYLLYGTTVVPFLFDDNFKELDPLRFAYIPDAVLEVVPTSSALPLIAPVQQSTPTSQSLSYSESDTNTHQIAVDKLSEEKVKDETTHFGISPASIVEETANEKSLIVGPGALPEQTRQFIHAYSQLFDEYSKALAAGQENQVANIKVAMNEHFDKLQVEMNRSNALQEQVQQLILEKQEQGLQMQEQMLKLQHQTLSRLAVIHDRVRVVLTQTYELHEYPIPRLFIVFPKPPRRRDKLKLFSDQFRLYFLCECGEHTKTEGNTETHEVHLAKHEGYEIERPNEFFQKYGKYLMTMMEMFKYGCVAAGIVVPALNHLHLVEGMETIKKTIDQSGHTMGSLVDQTISFLKKTQEGSTNNDIVDIGSDENDFRDPEVLEGADLRQLESYLRVKDKARVLGNLYRIVTHEGHVKWVCIDHYRKNYRESMMKDLRDLVIANDGIFDEKNGAVKIKLISNVLAKQFYEALSKTRGIQELNVILAMEMSTEDIRKFATEISKANIVQLTVNIHSLYSSRLDAIINSNRRFDPLLQLMDNKRIRTFKIEDSSTFFQRVTIPSITIAPELRLLSIEPSIDVDDKVHATAFITKILGNCRSLAELHVCTTTPISLINLMIEKLDHLRLDTIDAEYSDGSAKAVLYFSPPEDLSNRSIVPLRKKLLGKIHRNTISKDSNGITVHVNAGRRIWRGGSISKSLYGEFGSYFNNLGMEPEDDTIKSLDKATNEKGSRLTNLFLKPESLTSTGMDSLIRVLERSHKLESVSMTFCYKEKVWMDKLGRLLRLIGKNLDTLVVHDTAACMWFAEAFPYRLNFPVLSSLKLICFPMYKIPQCDAEWISNFLQNPTRQQTDLPPQLSSPPEAWKPLKLFHLTNCQLSHICWTEVIQSLDFSTLEEISFHETNFSENEMKTLINCISLEIKKESVISLRILDLTLTGQSNTWLNKMTKGAGSKKLPDKPSLHAMKDLIDELQKKVLAIKILYSDSRVLKNPQGIS